MKKERFGYPSAEAGYNLIEICIAMLIVGVLLASGAAAYSNYKKNQVSSITTANVASMAEAINSYRTLYGAYPCPAPLDQPRQGPNYGKPDCATTPAPGNCSNGICIQSSVDAAKGNIRIGALPFRVLNIDDEDTYDAYGSRLYYAVTDNLTNRSTYSETGGGIDIVDDAGASIVTPPASARYLIFSTGLDQAGGYSREGVLIRACNAANQDGENCDLTQTNAVFRSAMLTTAGTAQYFDDIIQPYIKSDPPLWKTTDANPNDIEDLSKDNIGIKASDPANDLEVEGNIKANADITTGESGNVMAAKLCPVGAGNCFEPRNIGGDAVTGVPGNGANGPGPIAGDGMACPRSYEAMKGIQYGGPECAPILVSEC
ncbi:MAG TPA: type II secretion system protein, partial [Micavibrio sp.]